MQLLRALGGGLHHIMYSTIFIRKLVNQPFYCKYCLDTLLYSLLYFVEHAAI